MSYNVHLVTMILSYGLGFCFSFGLTYVLGDFYDALSSGEFCDLASLVVFWGIIPSVFPLLFGRFVPARCKKCGEMKARLKHSNVPNEKSQFICEVCGYRYKTWFAFTGERD